MPIHGIRPTPTSLSDLPAAGLFLKNGQPLSVPPRNRKTPNGNSIGGFLFTFTRERVSRRNHNARRKTHPIFLVGSQHHFSQGISKCQSKTYQGEPRTVSFSKKAATVQITATFLK